MEKVLFFFHILFINNLLFVNGKSIEEYLNNREKLIAQENESFLGSDIELTPNEQTYNEILMSRKITELEASFESANFAPSQPFYKVKHLIESSEVFEMLKILPKGGVLHVHDFAITSVDWIIKNVTYR